MGDASDPLATLLALGRLRNRFPPVGRVIFFNRFEPKTTGQECHIPLGDKVSCVPQAIVLIR